MFRSLAMLSPLLVASTGGAQTGAPAILFTDLVSGPSTGNSDDSQSGQLANQDGAIVTVWGQNLGTSPGGVTVGGVAARVYSWTNATAPADLYSRHKMQMISFQIPHGAPNGATSIQVNVNGVTTNTLPFTVQPGKIYYVKNTGNDSSGNGSWQSPWQTLPAAVLHMSGGDILYACDGVAQTTQQGDRSTFNLETDAFTGSQWASQAAPKALIAYPGANVSVGNTAYMSAYSTWPGGGDIYSAYWVIAKLNLTANQEPADYGVGFRIVGNHLTAPLGDGQTGGIAGGDSTNLYILGNELTNIGARGTSKLYHPMYVQSLEKTGLPHLPDESNREIGWNYLHDNYAYDGINIYRENSGSAFMLNTRVHDNYIINQTGRGMEIGSYLVGPDNYFYNNVIINAGQGPASNYTSDPAFGYVCVDFQAGWSDYPGTTTIHFYNNTLYGCGFTDSAAGISGGMIAYANNYPFVLDFRNNIVQATGWPYVGAESDPFPSNSGSRNVWWGQGAPPSLDTSPIASDPLLVSPAPPTGDAHLRAGSPAIGAGSTAAPSAATDFDSRTRPSPPSIGAFELSGATAPAPDTTAPSVPTGLTATAASSSQVNVSWTASTDPDNSPSQIAYKVYRNGAQVGTTPAGVASYADNGLAASTQYSYSVSAFDPAGNNSAQTAPVLVTTSGNTGLPVISSFAASPSSISAGGSSLLSWSVSSATTLSISGIGSVTGSSTSVSPAQTTTYVLTATNGSGSATAQTTVTVTAPAVSIGISPTTASLGQGQQQQFAANVSGATNTAVTWSLTPPIGTLSNSGLYVAPASITSQQTIQVRATAAADTTKSAVATITLVPPTPVVSISVSPTVVTLGPGQQQQFAAMVTGGGNTAVTWSLSSPVGSLSNSGLYTAPPTITGQQTVQVRATAAADPTKTAVANITLNPPSASGISISWTQISPTQIGVTWTAPAGYSAYDAIWLTGYGAEPWWSAWSMEIGKQSSGSVVINVPAGPGIYWFEYVAAANNAVLAKSGNLLVGLSQYSVAASPTSVAAGGNVNVSWTAPGGRPSNGTDMVGLYLPGSPDDQPISYQYTKGAANGQMTLAVPPNRGVYEVRYVIDVVATAVSSPITVQ